MQKMQNIFYIHLYVLYANICRHVLHIYNDAYYIHLYVLYANICRYIPHIYIYIISNVPCIFYYFTESVLIIHEYVRQQHWIPVAFMPKYDQEKSKRSTQGYECDYSNEVMPRLLEAYSAESGTWKDKTQNVRVVSLGNCSRH